MNNACKILFVLTTYFLFACSKNKSTPIDPGDVYLTYKVDGVAVLYKGTAAGQFQEGVIGIKLTDIPTRYVIEAVKGTTNAITLGITTDSLTTNNYVADSVFSLIVENGHVKGVYNKSQVLNISITRYSSGTIDGTFSGKIYAFDIATSHYDSFTLTDGAFKNVEILY